MDQLLTLGLVWKHHWSKCSNRKWWKWFQLRYINLFILFLLFFAWLTTRNINIWISIFYAWWYYHNSVLRKIDNGSSLFYYIYDHYFQLTAHYMYRDIIWSFSTDSLFPSSECEMDTINGCYIFLLLIGWKD